MSSSDRELLLEFVNSLRSLLRGVLEDRQLPVSQELHEHLWKAWLELEHEGLFERLEKNLTSDEYDYRLREHGLYGAQLELKTYLFRRARTAVEREGRKPVRRRRRWKRLLGWSLKAANVLLGSLGEAIPGSSAIKEFKEALETALEEKVPPRQRIRSWFRRRWS